MNQIKVLQQIAIDMKNDAKDFDGRPFNGRTVATYFGNQGAAIAALARILECVLTEREVRLSTTLSTSGAGPGGMNETGK